MKIAVSILAVIGALALPGAAHAQSDEYMVEDMMAEGGLRVEARAMWVRMNDPVESQGINYELGSGIGYGAEIGYDIPVGTRLTVGPFASYSDSSIRQCDGDFCVKTAGYWVLGGKVGLAAGTQGELYGKLGYGNATIDAKGTVFDPITNASFQVDDSQSGGGYMFAIGYNHYLDESFYLGGEVAVGENRDIYGYNFQRAHLGVHLGARF